MTYQPLPVETTPSSSVALVVHRFPDATRWAYTRAAPGGTSVTGHVDVPHEVEAAIWAQADEAWRNDLSTNWRDIATKQRALLTRYQEQLAEVTAGGEEARHWFGPGNGSGGAKSKGKGHPIMYGRPPQARDFTDFPDGGGYPIGFPEAAYEWMGVTCPDLVLHLCSGSMRRGVRVDIRAETEPDIVCDARATPFDDESFDWIMIDPPYSEDYARNLYGTEANYPRPGQLMKEASRLLKPGGKVGLLHFQVPMIRKPLRVVEVRGITTGSGFNIRAFTICEKAPALREEEGNV